MHLLGGVGQGHPLVGRGGAAVEPRQRRGIGRSLNQ